MRRIRGVWASVIRVMPTLMQGRCSGSGAARLTVLLLVLSLCACANRPAFRPLPVIKTVDLHQGYRFLNLLGRQPEHKDTFTIIMFSGGGTRAAAFGYGALEAFAQQPVWMNGRRGTLFDNADMVFGISGGSVLAAYYSLHGKATIPAFEQKFLDQNLQKVLARQLFSVSNWPRLYSPQFGRGDILQEQLNRQLFHGATYEDLDKRRQGPFAVISATDMGAGQRLDFVQETFDGLCVDLNSLPVARAVASSSAVPLVFAPLTLNNHGGHCGYLLPHNLASALSLPEAQQLQTRNLREYAEALMSYSDSTRRPYLHLIDGGLTDNLGLRTGLDIIQMFGRDTLMQTLKKNGIKKVILININARSLSGNLIDTSPDIPSLRAVGEAAIAIPIDQNSQLSMRQMRSLVDEWNQNTAQGAPKVYFINLNLTDLPPSSLRDAVVTIPTTFYLPPQDIRNLRKAAAVLLQQSKEYRQLIHELAEPAPPSPAAEAAPPDVLAASDVHNLPQKTPPPEQEAGAPAATSKAETLSAASSAAMPAPTDTPPIPASPASESAQSALQPTPRADPAAAAQPSENIKGN